MTDALQFSVVVALKRSESRGVTVGKTSKTSVSIAEWSRAYAYDCCGAIKTSSNPLATFVKERLSPSTKNTVTECYEL